MHMDRVRQLVRYWCDDTFSGKCLGKGVTAAVLDTGLAPHPDFRGRVRVFLDLTKGKKQLRQPYDDSGHGTHVAGILAGDGRMSGGLLAGMAPEAELVILKVLDEKGEGSIEDILRGIRWVEENAARLGIRVVNISVGAKSGLGEEKERRLLSAVETLWDQNLVVTVSAGNQGPWGRIRGCAGHQPQDHYRGSLKDRYRSAELFRKRPYQGMRSKAGSFCTRIPDPLLQPPAWQEKRILYS